MGREFPPDVRLFYNQLVEAKSMAEVQEFVLQVRKDEGYSAEAYSYNISDTSGEYPDVLIGSIPEAKSGVTGYHVLAQMIEVDKRAKLHKLPLIGHCTDSAANALKGLAMLAMPCNFMGHGIEFIGLPISQYRFYSLLLRPPYPSIAYVVDTGRQNQNIATSKHW